LAEARFVLDRAAHLELPVVHLSPPLLVIDLTRPPMRASFVSPGRRCAIARPIVIALIVDTEDASRDHRARRRLGASSGEVGLTLALIRSPEVSGRRRVLSQGALTA